MKEVQLLQGQLGRATGDSKQRRGLWLWTSTGGKAEEDRGHCDPRATSIWALQEDLGALAPARPSDTDPHGPTAGAARAEAAARPPGTHRGSRRDSTRRPQTTGRRTWREGS